MPSTLTPLCLGLALAFGMMGCQSVSSRADYPDSSPETSRKVDDVKREAQDRRDVIETAYNQRIQELAFRDKQVRDKAKNDTDSLDIATQQQVDRLTRQRKAGADQTKHDVDEINAQTEEKLKTSPTDQATQIRSDADARIADLQHHETDRESSIDAQLSKIRNDAKQHQLDVDMTASKDLLVVQGDESDARIKMREKRLAVDRWLNDQLATINKESAASHTTNGE